jgi:hypothetical protein
MSAPVLDARAHAEAVKAAITAALAPKWSAYDFDEVPGDKNNLDDDERAKPLPNLYAVVSVEQVSAANQRMSGQTGTTLWIASIRGVGRTVAEAQWVRWRIAVALHEKRLVIESRDTEPLQLQPGQAPELDEGRYSGLAIYTYSH